jgi:hypothetical protein
VKRREDRKTLTYEGVKLSSIQLEAEVPLDLRELANGLDGQAVIWSTASFSMSTRWRTKAARIVATVVPRTSLLLVPSSPPAHPPPLPLAVTRSRESLYGENKMTRNASSPHVEKGNALRAG